jgi:hypothetical protein
MGGGTIPPVSDLGASADATETLKGCSFCNNVTYEDLYFMHNPPVSCNTHMHLSCFKNFALESQTRGGLFFTVCPGCEKEVSLDLKQRRFIPHFFAPHVPHEMGPLIMTPMGFVQLMIPVSTCPWPINCPPGMMLFLPGTPPWQPHW